MSLRRIIERKKKNIDPLMRVLITTHVEKVNDLLPLFHKADYLDDIHAGLRRRWEIQSRINFSRNYDRWYEADRKRKEMIKAKMADRWPRWFWKYWGFVDEEAWNSYMEWKKEKTRLASEAENGRVET